MKVIKNIRGYPNYGVDANGTIWNTKLNKKLSPRQNGKGYLHVSLCNKDGCRNKYVHRLVAAAFHGPLKATDDVNHIKGNKLDNRATQLEVITHKENIAHAEKTKLINRNKDGKFK